MVSRVLMNDTAKIERVSRAVSDQAVSDTEATQESAVQCYVDQTLSTVEGTEAGRVNTEEIYLEFLSGVDVQADDLVTLTSRTGNPEYRVISALSFPRHSVQCRAERRLAP